MSPRLVLALVVTLGCAPSVASEVVRLESGVAIEIPVDGEVRREEDQGRVALRLDDGTRIVVQRVTAEDRESGGRTPSSVAAALARRVELGEREGELAHHACRVAGRAAECTVGWTLVDGERFARRGMLLDLDGEIVWIDVAGPEDRTREVTARSSALRDAIRIAGQRG